jgi:hypothetical protein
MYSYRLQIHWVFHKKKSFRCRVTAVSVCQSARAHGVTGRCQEMAPGSSGVQLERRPTEGSACFLRPMKRGCGAQCRRLGGRWQGDAARRVCSAARPSLSQLRPLRRVPLGAGIDSGLRNTTEHRKRCRSLGPLSIPVCTSQKTPPLQESTSFSFSLPLLSRGT